MLRDETILQAYLLILTIWFVLSILNQIDDFSRKVSRFDYLNLLPRWTFFAPNPGISDVFLVYRTADKSLDLREEKSYVEHRDAISRWRELIHPSLAGHEIVLLWRPSRRASKAIVDLAQCFYRGSADLRINKLMIKLSLSYLIFCDMVEKFTEPGEQYQWAVVVGHGFQGRRSLRFQYISGFHRKGPSI